MTYERGISLEFGEEFYRKVMDASHDEICVADNNGNLIYCNKAFEKNYGIKKEEMLGKNVKLLSEKGYSTIGAIPQVLITKKTKAFDRTVY